MSFSKIIPSFIYRFFLYSIIIIPMAMIVGTICAFFLWCLKRVTEYRFYHSYLLYFLPLAGCIVALFYYWWGKRSEGGNNLILDELHDPGAGVPLRMAPLVFFGTIISHLFGASVGREGTAIQLGGSISAFFAKIFKLDKRGTRILLMAGIAAGFGSVFGNPIAGAIFGLEVVMVGRIDYTALLPVAVASIVADWVCCLWGTQHAIYPIHFPYSQQSHCLKELLNGINYHVDIFLLLKVAIVSVAFGLASWCFAEGVQNLSPIMKKICPISWLRPALGGILTISLVFILGIHGYDYLGLGVNAPPFDKDGASIINFFGNMHYLWSWAFKLIFTIIALSTGFKGGEVTPLFFIGSALGNAIAPFVGVPGDLLASIGFVAVFAGAANTPIACTVMAVELFGSINLIYYACGCIIAYLVSGNTGIYLSQRIATPKIWHEDFKQDSVLREARKIKNRWVRK